MEMGSDASGDARPLLIYDGECGFCRRWVERWRARIGDRIAYAPFQEVAGRFPSIPTEDLAGALHLILPDGQVFRGAEAVYRALAHAPGGGWLLWLYRRLPGFSVVSERVYRLVARHRVLASKVTQFLVGPDIAPATYQRSTWLFLRALGGVFLIAFASFLAQLPGLIGSGGIEPAAGMLGWAERALEGRSFWRLPTIFWLDARDVTLQGVCAAGVGLSLLVMSGVAQRISLAWLWFLYLSLVCVGGPFLRFQWDMLLLEVGLVSVVVAPAALRPRVAALAVPGPGPLFLLRWIMFRLMLLSGVVKLASGDAAWWSLRALEYHFWTQPLPTWIGFHAHHLPAWLQRSATGTMFVIELVLPFFIFGTRRMRRIAAAGFALLQLCIVVTGNYGFFNLLTLVLCLPLVDDGVWVRLFPRWGRPREAPGPVGFSWPRRVAFAVFATLVVLVSLVAAAQRFGRLRELPRPLEEALARVEAFHSINAYGLFAIMTTERPEIEVEGSHDGREWRAYGFEWKPGPPERRPAFVAPHQPRLDWQMWFAALGSCRSNPWFLRFQQRLLEGAPAVLALLEVNPFPEAPPRYMRSTLYQYRFSQDSDQGYWVRERVGPYCPTLMLEAGELRRAEP